MFLKDIQDSNQLFLDYKAIQSKKAVQQLSSLHYSPELWVIRSMPSLIHMSSKLYSSSLDSQVLGLRYLTTPNRLRQSAGRSTPTNSDKHQHSESLGMTTYQCK